MGDPRINLTPTPDSQGSISASDTANLSKVESGVFNKPIMPSRDLGVLLHNVKGKGNYGELLTLAKSGNKSNLNALERDFLRGLYKPAGELFYITDDQVNRIGMHEILLLINKFRIEYEATNIRFKDEKLDALVKDNSVDMTGGASLSIETEILPVPEQQLVAEWSPAETRTHFLNLTDHRFYVAPKDAKARLGHGFMINGITEELLPMMLDKLSANLRGTKCLRVEYPFSKTVKFPAMEANNDFTKLILGDPDYDDKIRKMVLSYLRPTTPRRITAAAAEFIYRYAPYEPGEAEGIFGELRCYAPADQDPEDYGFKSWNDFEFQLEQRLPPGFVARIDRNDPETC